MYTLYVRSRMFRADTHSIHYHPLLTASSICRPRTSLWPARRSVNQSDGDRWWWSPAVLVATRVRFDAGDTHSRHTGHSPCRPARGHTHHGAQVSRVFRVFFFNFKNPFPSPPSFVCRFSTTLIYTLIALALLFHGSNAVSQRQKLEFNIGMNYCK